MTALRFAGLAGGEVGIEAADAAAFIAGLRGPALVDSDPAVTAPEKSFRSTALKTENFSDLAHYFFFFLSRKTVGVSTVTSTHLTAQVCPFGLTILKRKTISQPKNLEADAVENLGM